MKSRGLPIIESPRLSTGLSTFPPGQSGSGAHSGWNIGMTLGGGAWYTHSDGTRAYSKENQVILAKPGTAIYWHVPIEPPEPVEESNTQPNNRPGWHVVYAVFHARAHWHDWLHFTEYAPGYSRLTPEDPRILRKIRRGLINMHRLATGSLPDRIEFALNALEEVLLWCRSDQARRSSPLDVRVSAAVDYLTSHLRQHTTLEQLAAISHSSRSHLAFLFERQVGVPPIEFLHRLRIERAMQMLQMTTDPIKAIAASVGFDDVKYFAKRFKRQTGVTPKHYRRQAALRA